MMPQHAPTARICRDCDGFPTVAITTGTRHPDGTHAIFRVTCTACDGTGHTALAVLTRTGRTR